MTGGILSGKDLSEIHEQAKEHDEKHAKMVYVKDDNIIIDVEYEYDIRLSRCDTHAKIIAWVIHLADKTWMTQDVLVRFVRLAMHENGLEAPMA